MKEVYIILKSTGQWDDYYDDPYCVYFDETLAKEEMKRLNNELHEIKNSDEYGEYLKVIEEHNDSPGSLELFQKYDDISRQNDYFIKKVELKDFYKIREENINLLN